MSISQSNPETHLAGLSEGWGPIVPVPAERRLEAVRRLVAGDGEGDRLHARRFLQFAEENRIGLDAMWSRLDGAGAVRATMLAVPNPGRSAMVFATPVRAEADVGPIGELVDHGCRQLARMPAPGGPVRLAQVLLDPAEDREHRMYAAAGLHRLASLSYLERPLPGPKTPRDLDWPDGVTTAAYDETLRGELIGILEASYEQTLDCPGLLGRRTTEDILCGHLATGQFDPALWTLLRVDGRPAGALLLNPSSQGRCVELVYLGLALFARRRGLGRRLLRHGLRQLRGRRERSVTLAVDDRNAPALGLYEQHGFRRVLRRTAMIRSIDAAPA